MPTCKCPEPALCTRLKWHFSTRQLIDQLNSRPKMRAFFEARAEGHSLVVHVPRPQCKYLGSATGNTPQCLSCQGTVRIKTFACAVHGECTTHKPITNVACCMSCDWYCSTSLGREVARFDQHNLGPHLPGLRFNASLLEDGDGYLIACRNGWAGSQILLGRLDAQLQPVGTMKALNLWHRDASIGAEDPRLFRYRGKLHVAFIGVAADVRPLHTNQLYAQLGERWNVEEIFHPQYADRTAWEKNWACYEHDGDLLAVYSIDPHRIIRIDGNRTELVHETPTPKCWQGGTPRGGGPPVRVGSEYWHFFHARLGNQWSPTYNMGLACFQAEPPFRLTRMTPWPILMADRKTKPEAQYAPVWFVCGSVRRERDWLLSAGVHDRWVELRVIDHADLEKALVSLS